MSYTTKFKELLVPEKGEAKWAEPIQDTFEDIDTYLKGVAETSVSKASVEATTDVTYPDGVTITSHPTAGERGLQPEGEQAGLAADATGVKYTGKVEQTIDSELLDGASTIRLEAATASSAGDETVTVEIYDGTSVVDSLAISGGGQASADVTASLASGSTVVVRWNVTTASATAGATFDAIAARLVVV